MKDFFVNSIPIASLDDDKNIPTVLFYDKVGKVFIGHEAINFASPKNLNFLHQEFKINLGNIKIGESSKYKNFRTISGDHKSSLGLTKDFIIALMNNLNPWLIQNNITNSKKNILVAEPIAIHGDSVEDGWLTNYRRNVREILEALQFENVDFLPEPFAVFQYYRYKIRHPLITGNQKQCVLVMDFGGGTFDTCVIETTIEGDIRRKGKNSRPLGAHSVAIGGFFINKQIVKKLLIENLPVYAKKIKQAYDIFEKERKGAISRDSLSEENKNFIEYFHALMYSIENDKLAICRSILNWSLDNYSDIKILVNIPDNPFVKDSPFKKVYFSGQTLLEIFTDEIWNRNLKQAIKLTLERAKDQLENQSISTVLFSGGSSNIGWLRELFEKDFSEELKHPHILKIDDFQEVVSKGLAVECMRRFYNDEGGDFQATTYNTLNLLLGSNNMEVKTRTLKPLENKNLATNIPGVLLKSATSLLGFIDEPLTWKVKLEKQPKPSLQYYFLKSSFDHEDITNLQNIIETKIDTPSDILSFDSQLKIQLTIKEDGTVFPKFIYHSNSKTPNQNAYKDCKPFYLDMTFGNTVVNQESYLGLDFGTTNTSLSYIDKSSVQLFESKMIDKSWLELNELISKLPYPLSTLLANYLSNFKIEDLVKNAKRFYEFALAFISYSIYSELGYQSIRKDTYIFKSFDKMSAGPLWKLLKDFIEGRDNKGEIANKIKECLTEDRKQIIDSFVTTIAKLKHDQIEEQSVDTTRPMKTLANICNLVFQNHIFGFFSDVKKVRLNKYYDVTFRKIHEKPPFTDFIQFRSAYQYEEQEPLLISTSSGTITSLSPLIFWSPCKSHPYLELGHCYFYDKSDSGVHHFKSADDHKCIFKVTVEDEYIGVLAEELNEMKIKDMKKEKLFENVDIFKVSDIGKD